MKFTFIIGGLLLLTSCNPSTGNAAKTKNMTEQGSAQEKTETAVFGAGCFWCVEAVFEELQGVQSVVAGYTGGHVKRPAYREVCTGRTGHAEVAKIIYNPNEITFAELLEVFWQTHDPTTLNRQGADVGTQYRSAIFYVDEKQKAQAEEYKSRLNSSGAFTDPIVTEITPLGEFYEAEQDHQDYYSNNPEQAYCQAVIRPKLDKFRKAFSDKLKDSEAEKNRK